VIDVSMVKSQAGGRKKRMEFKKQNFLSSTLKNGGNLIVCSTSEPSGSESSKEGVTEARREGGRGHSWRESERARHLRKTRYKSAFLLRTEHEAISPWSQSAKKRTADHGLQEPGERTSRERWREQNLSHLKKMRRRSRIDIIGRCPAWKPQVKASKKDVAWREKRKKNSEMNDSLESSSSKKRKPASAKGEVDGRKLAKQNDLLAKKEKEVKIKGRDNGKVLKSSR